MASLSELMKNRNGGNTVGASGSAATSGRSLSQLMGIPTRSEREGLGELSISKLNENRQRMVQQRINAAKQAEREEKQRQQALRARYVGQDSLVGQMQKDRAAAAVASANAQVTLPKSTGLDDNSLAYQMLRDRAASEQKQQSLPFEERIHNALNSSGDLAAVYQKFPEITGSFTGTPAQDALNDYLMRRTDYSTYQTAPDFEKYSEMGDALKSPSFDRKTLHTFMTENEKKTYSYLLAKEGEQSAQRYLDSITETLNRRYGEKIAADVEGVRGTYLHPIVTAGVAAQSGLDRFTGSVAQAFSKYERPTSVMQYAGQAVREDQGAVGKFAYDAVNTLSNMAPSILASFLTAGLGAPAAVASFAAAGTLGLGSGGNAYKQALEEGHSKEEAQTVAVLTGASEAVLSKLLSGISAFGGVSAEKLLPKVAAIENAAWRVLGAAGVKLGGEIAEEELQNFLEPLFKTIVYGDEYDVPTIGELAYTAFLTALTTGVLEGGEIAQYRTKEGAASAAQTEVQRTAQGSAESVSEQSSIPGGGQAKNAPVASQTEQRAVNAEQRAVSTGLRDPMQVLLEENRKAQAQKNENSAAEMQRNVSKESTDVKSDDTESMRVALAEQFERGEITEAEYNERMESIEELESLDDFGSGSLDAYNPDMMKKMEVNTDGRSSVSDDGSQRAKSQSAGKQAGALAEGTGRYQSRQLQSQRAAGRRDDVSRYYESRGKQPVSARDYLGTGKVNKVSTVQEMPAEMVTNDAELSGIAEEIRAMGMTPHLYVGDARLRNGNSVDGLIRGKDVYIRVDGDVWTATQNWDHEKAHAILRQSPGIEARLYGEIVGRGEAARRKLHQTMQRYREAYHGIYDMDENGNEIWDDTVQEMILQEILADAYAGKDTFAQGVEEHADMSREAVSQIEERGGEVRGPPEESFSVKRTRVVPYQKQIDAYYKNDAKVLGRSDDIFVLDTTSDLSDLGLGEKPFFMLKSNLTKSVRKEGNNKSNSAHGIEEDVVRDLPDLIKSPALVVVGDGRISIISDVTVDTKNESNAPLLIGIDPQSSVDGQDAYEIKSIYGRERFSDWLELRAKDSKILAGNANKAAALLRNVGKSYPEPVAYATDLTSWILSQSETPVKRGESFSARESAQESSIDSIDAMPTKARKIMERAEWSLNNEIGKVFGIPYESRQEKLAGIAREISNEFLETGTVSDETIDRTFEQAYSVVESEVEQQHGVDAEDYRQWAERDYIAEVAKHLAELRLVKRYAAEKAQQAARDEADTIMTLEELGKTYQDLKAARRGADKAVARNLLTESDERKVHALLRGDIDLDMLKPETDNVRGITEVYNAKLEYEKVARRIRRWNATRKGELRALADKLLESASDWTDKGAGWLYSRETMERNIRDIVPDKKVAQEVIDTLFKPVHDGAAAANKMKNEYRDKVRKLNLSREVKKGNEISEAAAVQLLGEAEDNIRHLEQNRFLKERDGKSLEDWQGIVQDLWEKNPKLDAGKIRKAVKEFREIYDELFEQMNTVRMRNGYEPVNYRKGYFPHFQSKEGDGILGQFGKALGVNTAAMQLPTTINGLTHTFKPGMQWFGSAQQRMGVNTAFDAVEGFDSYIEGVADVINQTDNIQRLRAFAAQVRYRTSEEGIRKQVDAIQNDPTIAPEDKQNRIEKLYAEGKFELSNLAVELDEYTNLLAGKKSRHDRDMEQKLGRRMYAIMKGLEGRVAANMVAINPGSWLTNFIPITQGAATLDTRSLLSGMWDTLKAYKQNDGFVDASSFLTNRRGSDPLVRTWTQKASAKMSSPMELIDSFTADTLVRARYNENVRRGLSEAEAMADADAWAAGVMADRSKGAMPTLFSQTNPLTKLLTQFQLEVNNQLSYVFKDIPEEMKEKGVMALAMALFKFMIGAYLYNELYEKLIGRRPALDPIGMLKEAAEDVKTEGAYDAGVNLAVGVVEELPFVGSLLGGGRLPISSAIPDFGKLWQAISDSDWDSKKRVATAAKELAKPATYLALPFGGGQVKKVVEGVEAIAREGSYSVDSSGADILQYPVYASTPGEAGAAAVRALFFGKSALPTAQEWVKSDFDSLNARQTEVYQSLVNANISSKTAYETIRKWEDIGGNKEMPSYARGLQQRGLITSLDVPDRKKLQIYATLSGSSADTRVEKFARLMDKGLTWREIMIAFNRQQELNNDETIAKASDKAAKFAEYVLGEMTVDKALAAIEEMKFYVTMASAPSQGSLKDALNRTRLSTREKRTVWYDYCELYGWKAESPW